MIAIRTLSTFALACTAAVLGGCTAGAQQEAEPTTFLVRVENVSTEQTLRLSNGTTAPAPTAPVLWVIHSDGEPIFSDGAVDRGLGLESLAEEGDPGALAGRISDVAGVIAAGAVAIPVGDAEPGPALPGKAFEFTVTASAGQRLSLAFMFGQSNDLFYAFAPSGIELFPNGRALSGVVAGLELWDAGTEVNEEPGLGPNQAPRQPSANTGASERLPIQLVTARRDGFSYPSVNDVVRVTVTPQPAMSSSR